MKKLYTLIVIALVGFIGKAQIVNIPDANFKAKLLSASPSNNVASGDQGPIKIDTNNDGQIQVNEAQIVKALNVSNSNISNLTGISAFTAVGDLDCSYNQLTTLDLSNNTGVNPNIPGESQFSANISCNNNQLTSIQLPSLYYFNIDELNFSNNFLQTIQLPLGAVDYFSCNNNPNLTSILANTTSISLFDFGLDYTFTMASCPNLTLFCVYNAYHAQAQALVNGYGYTNCQVTSSCQLGVEEFTNNDVVLYPNPAKNSLTITTKQDVTMRSVSIYNMLGQLVQVHTNPSESIDVSGLQSGSYFMRIASDKGSATGKFIKE